jgi:hypothetical protein
MWSRGQRSSVESMTSTLRHATWATGIAVAALLVPAPAAAVTNRPAPEPNYPTEVVIQRVEVPVAVPVDDVTTEAAQMAVAAALGVAIGIATRRRRARHQPAPTGTRVIDITDSVRL